MLQRVISAGLSLYLNTLSFIAPKKAAEHAFWIFCYPFAAKLRPHQEKFLDTAERRRIPFQGDEIQLYRWGHGKEKVLCVHGWQSNSFRWKKFIDEAKQERYTLYAFDAPGHGRSGGRFLNVPIYAEALSQVMKEIGPIDHILCHSIGGFACLYAYNNLPLKEPKSMVLLAPPGNAEEFFNYFLTFLRISKKLERNMRDYFLSYTGHPVSYFQTPPFAERMNCPALIIHDRNDRDTSYRHSENLHQAWANSELLLSKGFGHKLKDISIVEKSLAYIEQSLVLSTAD